jgi:c-di-GMP-binding flagellar brake protein YcgR
MNTKNRLGDRREHLRFDVSGQLWASLDFGERVIVRNVTAGGMLIETSLTPALKPVRAAQIAFEERNRPVTAIIRHVSPVSQPLENDRYLVGLEFINLSPSQQVDLEQLVRNWQEQS